MSGAAYYGNSSGSEGVVGNPEAIRAATNRGIVPIGVVSRGFEKLTREKSAEFSLR
jgi:hypothetical protein